MVVLVDVGYGFAFDGDFVCGLRRDPSHRGFCSVELRGRQCRRVALDEVGVYVVVEAAWWNDGDDDVCLGDGRRSLCNQIAGLVKVGTYGLSEGTFVACHGGVACVAYRSLSRGRHRRRVSLREEG